MSKLCKRCRNLLKFSADGNFVCKPCNITYPLAPIDTLLSSNNKLDEGTQFQKYLTIANKDPTIKRIAEKCPKCNNHYGIAHLGRDELTVKICDCT